MQSSATLRALGILLLFGLLAGSASGQTNDFLEAGFQSPPPSARPQTWWHWMNGNITEAGITADLEAMKQIGLGGAEIFNVDAGIPAGPVKFNSPEWHQMFQHAVREADRLGLQLEAHNCAGWSSSGGPWTAPSNSMMHVVTSEIQIVGPTNFSGVLPEPAAKLGFYRDIAVLAFPTPEGQGAEPPAPEVTASQPGVNGATLVGDHSVSVTLPLPRAGQPQFFQFNFSRPVVARSVRLLPAGSISGARGVVETSADGEHFSVVNRFTLPHRPTRPFVLTFDHGAVTAKVYRLTFRSLASDAKEISLRGVEFSARLQIQDFQTKDGDTGGFVDSMSSADGSAPGFAVSRAGMINLTGKVSPEGRLAWKVPRGNWTILRAGFTPNGMVNHPAPPEGTGLECDKFNPAALDAHWDGYMQKLVEDAGPLAGKTFNGGVIDSYEVGGQNWSARFREEFKKRRGYDPTPFMAAFSGYVVDNPEITERFLWDERRTIADLFADDYYGHFAELCHRHGMLASIEPYTGPFESLQCGKPADIVMGEFWAGSQGDPSVKLAASVAHIYGKTIVGAESFTAAPGPDHGRWLDDPYSLKALGDLEYCTGLNRFIFHRYAMQPWTNRWPGMTMGQWGFHFERTETWWTQGKAWVDYVSRCQFLLQQGRYVADVAYFNGENAPSEMPAIDPALPPGYQYDAVNEDVLLHHASMKNGGLQLDSGARYAVLVLPAQHPNLTPDLLRRLQRFVHDGLTVMGVRPEHSPSLQDYPRCDREVKSLAGKLWGNCNGSNVLEHADGRGRVVWGKPLDAVLAELQRAPDFEFHGKDSQSKLVYCHRRLPGAEIYFVSNQRAQFESADCSFRISGRTPELWNAETGRIETAPAWREENGRTIVPLQFGPAGSLFVIFRQPVAANHFVSVDFQPTASATSGQGGLKILRAEFGCFPPAGQPWREVTEKIKSMVAAGQHSLPANNDLVDEDPVPNTRKTLRVDYTIDGRAETAEVNEGENLDLPTNAVVTSAHYGKQMATNEWVEVTEQVASRIENGQVTVRADVALAGRDPVFGTPKELRVDYSLDGVVKHIVVPENEMLTLPASRPPDFDLATSSGKTIVREFVPGRLRLRSASGKSSTVRSAGDFPAPVPVGGPWTLRFPPNWGAPDEVMLDRLISWSDDTNAGVKYFSGTATYEKAIEIPATDLGNGREVWLDLGDVKNFAEVEVNGTAFPVLWKPPFRLNITGAAHPGANQLRVKVTNLWPNRLIGDEQLPPDVEWNGKALAAWPQWLLDGKPSPTGRLTFTTWHHWTKSDTLLQSGLLGPVTLRVAETFSVQPE